MALARYHFDGPALRMKRKAKGMKLERLAVALDRSVTMVLAYENNKAAPPVAVIAVICEVLDCTPADLLTRSRQQVPA